MKPLAHIAAGELRQLYADLIIATTRAGIVAPAVTAMACMNFIGALSSWAESNDAPEDGFKRLLEDHGRVSVWWLREIMARPAKKARTRPSVH